MTDETIAVNLPQEQKAGVAPRSIFIANSRFIIPALVVAVTFVAYMGTLRYDFVYDDEYVITQNPSVQSWAFVPHYFTEHLWFFKFPMSNYYRPIFLVWMALNHTLFGLNPVGYHLTTILAHVTVTLLVFHLARRLTGDLGAAAIASIVFGLHPAHIEGVAWVCGVSEPLMAMFLIGSFLCYLRYRDANAARRKRWLVASLVLAALAVFEKETGVILPALIFAYEVIFRRSEGGAEVEESGSEPRGSWLRWDTLGRALTRSLPFWAIAVFYIAVRVAVLGGLGRSPTPLSLATIAFTWPSLLWDYVKILVWPLELSVFYDTPYVVRPGFSNFVLPLLAVAIFAGGLWMLARRSRPGRLAAVWLVLPILPLLNIAVFRWGDIVHDRYMYLPSVGFVLIIALGLRRLPAGKSFVFGLPAVQAGAVVALTCFLGIALASQHIHWANNLLLFHNSLLVAPHSRDAKTKLGGAFIDRGMYKEGIQLLGEVYEGDPDSWDSNQEVGGALYKAGRYQDAERYLTRAIEIRPSRGESHYFLGIALLDMNRLAEAEAPLREAIRLGPRSIFYHYALGAWFDLRGDPRAAIEEFRLELGNNPNYAPARDKILEINARLNSSGAFEAPGVASPPGADGLKR